MLNIGFCLLCVIPKTEGKKHVEVRDEAEILKIYKMGILVMTSSLWKKPRLF